MKELLNDILSSEEFRNLLLMIITTIFGFLAQSLKVLFNEMMKKYTAQKHEAEAKVGKAQVEMIESIAIMAVRYAQQVFKDSGAEEKFKEAVDVAQLELTKRGINIGGEMLSHYVEAAYNTVKKEFKKPEDVSIEHTASIDDNVVSELDVPMG